MTQGKAAYLVSFDYNYRTFVLSAISEIVKKNAYSWLGELCHENSAS